MQRETLGTFISLIEESMKAPVDSLEGVGLLILFAFIVLLIHLLALFIIVQMGKPKHEKNDIPITYHRPDLHGMFDSKE